MPPPPAARKLPPWLGGHLGELWTAAVFAAQQAAGLPIAAAGAPFKPYGIDVVTLELPAASPQVNAPLLLGLPFGGHMQGVFQCNLPPASPLKPNSCFKTPSPVVSIGLSCSSQ